MPEHLSQRPKSVTPGVCRLLLGGYNTRDLPPFRLLEAVGRGTVYLTFPRRPASLHLEDRPVVVHCNAVRIINRLAYHIVQP